MKLNLRDSIFISLLISILIGGGYVLYIVSTYFLLPGMKYVILAPYLSLIICALKILIKNKWAVIKFNAVFAMIMSLISLYMSAAIIITASLSEITGLFFKGFSIDFRNIITSAFYSFYCVFISLLVLKYFIIASDILSMSFTMIFSLSLLGLILGIFGSKIGEKVGKRVLKIVVGSKI